MKLSPNLKGISKDIINSILGIGVLNVVIQFLVYPFFNRQLGAQAFGDVLTLLSVVAIMGAAFGTGANYSRMICHMRKEHCKGDYNLFLLYTAMGAVIVCGVVACWFHMDDWKMVAGYYVLIVFSIIRYYADVEFRIKLDYQKYCIYYVLIAVGYMVGILIYPISRSWILTILLGEIAAVIYTKIKGSIFVRPLFLSSEYYKLNMKSWVQLSVTQLIAISVLHADRIMLQMFCDGTAVTVFYAATLMGKIIALVSTPLNSVLIGYLSKYEGTLGKTILWKICLWSVPLGTLLNVFCTGASYLFVQGMYSDIFDLVRPYLWIANAGQIFYFISGTLMVLLMRWADEKYQLYINVAYMMVFFVLAVPMTIKWEVWGISWALLIGNLLRVLMIAGVGSMFLQKKMN